MKNKIHPHLDFDYAFNWNQCRWSHGYGKLECQCGLSFGHTGNCKCFDETCNMEWERPRL